LSLDIVYRARRRLRARFRPRSSSSAPPSAEEEYHASRWEIDRAGANVWGFLPPTAETVFARRSPENGGVLIAWSDASRGFSKKDRSWLQALARKLDLAFAS